MVEYQLDSSISSFIFFRFTFIKTITLFSFYILTFAIFITKSFVFYLYLLNFQIEKYESEKGCWMACGKSHDNTFEVKGLLSGHEYRFRVSAVNEFGDSDATEAQNKVCINPEPDSFDSSVRNIN